MSERIVTELFASYLSPLSKVWFTLHLIARSLRTTPYYEIFFRFSSRSQFLWKILFWYLVFFALPIFASSVCASYNTIFPYHKFFSDCERKAETMNLLKQIKKLTKIDFVRNCLKSYKSCQVGMDQWRPGKF